MGNAESSIQGGVEQQRSDPGGVRQGKHKLWRQSRRAVRAIHSAMGGTPGPRSSNDDHQDEDEDRVNSLYSGLIRSRGVTCHTFVLGDTKTTLMVACLAGVCGLWHSLALALALAWLHALAWPAQA